MLFDLGTKRWWGVIGKALEELNKVADELEGSWGKDFQIRLIRF